MIGQRKTWVWDEAKQRLFACENFNTSPSRHKRGCKAMQFLQSSQRRNLLIFKSKSSEYSDSLWRQQTHTQTTKSGTHQPIQWNYRVTLALVLCQMIGLCELCMGVCACARAGRKFLHTIKHESNNALDVIKWTSELLSSNKSGARKHSFVWQQCWMRVIIRIVNVKRLTFAEQWAAVSGLKEGGIYVRNHENLSQILHKSHFNLFRIVK